MDAIPPPQARPAGSPAPADRPPESLADHRAAVVAKFLALVAAGVRAVPTHQKRPTIRWKDLQWRPPTKRELGRAVCEKAGVDGYAVLTGRNPFAPDQSVYARDFDTVEAYEAWAESAPAAAAALYTVRSGRGYHVYARMPAGMPEVFVSFADPLRKGELKANRGYIVGPGSLHPSGRRYTPVNFPADALVTGTPEMHPVAAGFLSQDEFDAAVRKAERPAAETAPETPARVKERAPSPAYATLRPLTERQTRRLRALARRHAVRGEGERHARMWAFERALKGLPFLADQPPEAVLEAFEEWHARSRPHMRGKNLEANWRDFWASWPKVKRPGLSTLRDHARARLESDWRPAETRGLSDGCQRVAAVLAEVQRFVTLTYGRPDFFLSFSLLGELAGVSASTACEAVGKLRDLTLVKVVRKGVRCSAGGVATVYEFAGEWPPLGLDEGGPSSPSSTPSPASSMYSVEEGIPHPTEGGAPPKPPFGDRPAVSRPPPSPRAA